MLAGALALAAGLLLTPTAPAGGRQVAGPRPRLVSQTPWLAEDQTLVLSFSMVGGLPADGTVELTLYGPLTDRDVLVRANQDRSLLGETRDVLSIPAGLVPRRPDGAYTLRLLTDGSTAGLPVSDPGVYPLEVAVAGSDGVAGTAMLTWIVRTADDATMTALPTAVVLPLHVPPSTDPGGTTALSERARTLLDTRIRLLEKFADLPLTVAPTPELVAAVAREEPELLADLRAALRGRLVVGGTYVRVDLAAFAAVADLTEALRDQFVAGQAALQRHLRLPFDRRTWVGAGNPTSGALDALLAAGIDRAVLREEQVRAAAVPIDRAVTVTGATGQTVDAVLADSALRTYISGVADPVLTAQRTLADLALLATPAGEGGVATEDGGATGVVVKLPPTQPIPARYLDTLLQGLEAGGPVRPVTLDELYTPSGTTVAGVTATGQDLTAYGRNLSATRSIVDGYTSFAGSADPLVADLRERLLVSGSSDLTESARGAYLRATSEAISARTAQVAITDDETVTLTSREGDIPLTIRNDTGGPVEVELAFDSDNKLDFPDGASQRLRLVEGPNRIQVPVVARTSGSFPLRITATSPDGTLTVSRARVTVRSTVVSGVGVVLSVGALAVLVVWWAGHWRSARRNRRLVDPDAVGNPSEDAPV